MLRVYVVKFLNLNKMEVKLMSKLSKAVSQMNENNLLRKDETVTNFMNGDSYVINPLDTLKMIAASSIFGEASYYRNSLVEDGTKSYLYKEFTDEFYKSNMSKYEGMSTTDIFQLSIDDALSYDFEGTLQLAVELRQTFNMRLNPQIIMVRAAIHPDREKFTKTYPGMYKKYHDLVCLRADDPMSQLSYYLWLNNGNKNKIPSILKRSIANQLSHLNKYQINKYKNHEIGLVNSVRITHAHSDNLDELMKNGSVEVIESSKTWEQKRSAGMSWYDIIKTTNIGHMALLRNIRNVFEEVDDYDFCVKYMEKIIRGVSEGKQFPFRYYNAYNVISNSDVYNQRYILDMLEECIDISINNLPKLKGKTMCLSDNSGSAWGQINSEYGTVTIAEIDNLSAIIAGRCSDRGFVGKFGDKLRTFCVSKREGILSQTKQINESEGSDVGRSTEGGIWEFFRDAIKNKEFYDNIFIFSDQQAGTGGLYGTHEHISQYNKRGYSYDYHINVYKLILDYRKYVNPKVNIFSVQTAGYDNILIPDMSYRCAMFTGWTGKEILFASEYIKQWDEIESRK